MDGSTNTSYTSANLTHPMFPSLTHFLLLHSSYPCIDDNLQTYPEGWTHLPTPGNLDGSAGNSNTCVGCRRPCSCDATWTCLFITGGFSLEDTLCPACGIWHHIGCVRIGPPFHSRHRNASQGLTFNSQSGDFPFVCEFCTVRANVRRNLNPTHPDRQLLMLEQI